MDTPGRRGWPGSGPGSALRFLVAFGAGSSALLMGVLFFLAAVPVLGVGLTAGLTVIYTLLVWVLAGKAPVVTINQAAVTVVHRGARQSIPLG